MKEHWAKKLKRQLQEERAKVRELVMRPDSRESLKIKTVVKMGVHIEERVWTGSYGGTGRGIMDMMQDSSRVPSTIVVGNG